MPLPLFGTIILTGVVAAMLATRDVKNWTHRLFVFLVALYAVQSLLLCLRWGYEIAGAGLLVAVLAPVLPVCAYLAYLTLMERPHRVWAYLPVTIVANWVVLIAFRDLADVTILLTYIGFGVALLLRARKGSDALVLARMARVDHAVRAMILSAFSLIASGVVDVLVLMDFIRTEGQNVGFSITLAQSGFLLCVGIAALIGQLGATQDDGEPLDAQGATTDAADAEIHKRLSDLFLEHNLHHDTDLNLRRLARRLGLPDRTVLRAINRIEDQSVSQFVNNFRIRDACKMLRETDQSILQISLASGFLTKSNFNREFLRVTGQTPSQWRKRQK